MLIGTSIVCSAVGSVLRISIETPPFVSFGRIPEKKGFFLALFEERAADRVRIAERTTTKRKSGNLVRRSGRCHKLKSDYISSVVRGLL